MGIMIAVKSISDMFTKPFYNFKCSPMKSKIQTNRKTFNSMKQDYNPNYLYLTPSMIEKKSSEVVSSCNPDYFIADWQMYNTK